MGNFFNKHLMGLKRLPKRGIAEQMRNDFNAEINASTPTTEPLVKPRKKRRVRNADGKLVHR